MKLWKIKREIRRVIRQVLSLPVFIINFFLSTHYYDFLLSKRKNTFYGAQSLSERVAIFVIFPRRGLLRSHLDSIEYLVRKGMSVIVVSNTALDIADRHKLLPHVWKYIERPNYGYDFGAYRDGILSVADRLGALERLVIVNDSCWFPLPGGLDWIEEAERLNVHLAGAATNYAVQRSDPEEYRATSWNFDNARRSFHYCSFALMFSSELLADPKFLRFWKSLRLSNVKARTVRRGEIGLTQWVRRRGYSHGSVFDVSRLDQELASMDRTQLLNLVRSLIIPAHDVLKSLRHDLLDAETADPTLEELRGLALTIVAHQGMAYSLAAHLIEKNAYPFLKKSPMWLDTEAGDQTIQLIESLPGDSDDVLQEAVMLRLSAAND